MQKYFKRSILLYNDPHESTGKRLEQLLPTHRSSVMAISP